MSKRANSVGKSQHGWAVTAARRTAKSNDIAVGLRIHFGEILLGEAKVPVDPAAQISLTMLMSEDEIPETRNSRWVGTSEELHGDSKP